jgi:hypothetical protein
MIWSTPRTTRAAPSAPAAKIASSAATASSHRSSTMGAEPARRGGVGSRSTCRRTRCGAVPAAVWVVSSGRCTDGAGVLVLPCGRARAPWFRRPAGPRVRRPTTRNDLPVHGTLEIASPAARVGPLGSALAFGVTARPIRMPPPDRDGVSAGAGGAETVGAGSGTDSGSGFGSASPAPEGEEG